MGQLTRHSRVRGQNVTCAHAVVSHLAGLPVFFMKMYRRCLYARTPLGPITITYRGKENKENFLKVAVVKQWWIEEEA